MIAPKLVAGALIVLSAVVGPVVRSAPTLSERQGRTTGWIGSVTAAYEQAQGARLTLPAGFSSARLLVAVVANDGPDSDTAETHAVFGGTSELAWTRQAHISARQDWAAPGEVQLVGGASSAEIWTTTPPAGWIPRTVTEISNFPENTSGDRDDGGIITIAAWASGRLGQIFTLDGLNSRPERQPIDTLGPASSLYGAVFNGRANDAFTALPGFHIAAATTRRAGDDTAQVVASDGRDLPAGTYTVGYHATPTPGDYWEMAIVEVVPA